VPVELINGSNLLDEYFGKNSQERKEYKRFTGLVREYRNILIHRSIIGKVSDEHRNSYVPKKEKIKEYKRIVDVIDNPNLEKRFEHDFIDAKLLMKSDLNTLMGILNKLWEKPIKDFMEFLYEKKNPKLMELYGLGF